MTLAAAATTASDELTGVAAWAVGLMETVGAPGAAIAIAAENLFPPIPSEVILPLAGFTAAQGGFSLAEALIWTTVGSVVGALALYLVGRILGHDRVVWVAQKMPLIRADDVHKTTAWFRKHGGKAVLLGRVLPIFRSLISIPAGIERMAIWKFLLLTTIGSGVWNTIFVMAGFTLGRNWSAVEPYAEVLQWVVIVAVVALLAIWALRRIVDDRKRRTAGLDTETGKPV